MDWNPLKDVCNLQNTFRTFYKKRKKIKLFTGELFVGFLWREDFSKVFFTKDTISIERGLQKVFYSDETIKRISM